MVIGQVSTETILNKEQIAAICAEAFQQKRIDGKRLLFIIPDHSRTAPMDVMFRVLYDLLSERVQRLDFLLALGTHPPMSDEKIYQRVGISAEERSARYAKARFFNHRWDDPQQLVKIGDISEEEVAQLSGGLMRQRAEVTINRLVLDYDLLIILGPTFPHEVVGFSGGNKYLFPGIAGAEIIDMFHWLGALLTSPATIGSKYTPVREVVDRAAAMVPVERYALCLVVKGGGLAGLFAGPPEEAWSAAADLSDKVHVVYKNNPFHSVLARAPEMYDDLWTGGKCMYKLEPVVADGGELVIYAPHIDKISVTHGAQIEQIGYHVRDYFLKQMDRFSHISGGVMAHSTHVKGLGTFENGAEKARIKVTLATQIPPDVCARINLGYRDPATIHVEEWQNREDDGLLYVPKAGEMLYRLKNDPFRN